MVSFVILDLPVNCGGKYSSPLLRTLRSSSYAAHDPGNRDQTCVGVLRQIVQKASHMTMNKTDDRHSHRGIRCA
jgi:hypothetical protein